MRRPTSIAIAILMAAGAATLGLASLTHFGHRIPLGIVTLDDPFRGAALPEAIIGGVMVVGLIGWLSGRRWAWSAALGTTLLALAGVVLGLSIVLSSSAGRSGDIVYHVSLLVLLVLTLVLLLTPAARRTWG